MTEESEDEDNDIIRTHKLSWTSNGMLAQIMIQYMYNYYVRIFA